MTRIYKQAVNYHQPDGPGAVSVTTWLYGESVAYELQMLWRHGDTAWERVTVEDPPVTLAPGPVRLRSPRSPGLYYAVAKVAGHVECAMFVVGANRCTDLMFEVPPGRVRACDPERGAIGALDPLDVAVDGRTLRDVCGPNGFLYGDLPTRNGRAHGLVKGYDIHGNVTRIAPHVDGVIDGVVQDMRQGEGVPHPRVETPYVAGKRHGVQKGYCENGRVCLTRSWTDDTWTSEEQLYDSGELFARATMDGSHGTRTEYRKDGSKLADWKLVLGGSGMAHQCVTRYDESGARVPCR